MSPTSPVVPDLLSPEFAVDPYPFYRTFREEHPVVEDARLGWVISRYDDVRQAFTDPDFSTETYAGVRELVGRSILEMDGYEHANYRRLVAPFFRGRALDGYEQVIENAAHELVTAFDGAEEVDLVEEFCAQLPIRVIMGMMNLPKADYRQFQIWYRAAAAYVGNYAGDPAVAEAGLRAKRELDEYLAKIVVARRAEPGTDLISAMCTAEIDETSMSDREILDFCSLLLAAGGETTERAIASALRNLLDHPDQLEQVRADPALIVPAFAESTRLNPPTHIILRRLTTDKTLSGVQVPSGATVFCLIGAANRDPRRYADAERFDPHRTDLDIARAFTAVAGHFSFGAGRHFCVGALLARKEAEIGLRMLLDTVREMAYVPGFVPVEEGTLTRAPRHLRVNLG
jgi:cytochrome P450